MSVEEGAPLEHTKKGNRTETRVRMHPGAKVSRLMVPVTADYHAYQYKIALHQECISVKQTVF